MASRLRSLRRCERGRRERPAKREKSAATNLGADHEWLRHGRATSASAGAAPGSVSRHARQKEGQILDGNLMPDHVSRFIAIPPQAGGRFRNWVFEREERDRSGPSVWQNRVTAFEAAPLIKPPALRGVSRFVRDASIPCMDRFRMGRGLAHVPFRERADPKNHGRRQPALSPRNSLVVLLRRGLGT